MPIAPTSAHASNTPVRRSAATRSPHMKNASSANSRTPWRYGNLGWTSVAGTTTSAISGSAAPARRMSPSAAGANASSIAASSSSTAAPSTITILAHSLIPL